MPEDKGGREGGKEGGKEGRREGERNEWLCVCVFFWFFVFCFLFSPKSVDPFQAFQGGREGGREGEREGMKEGRGRQDVPLEEYRALALATSSLATTARASQNSLLGLCASRPW